MKPLKLTMQAFGAYPDKVEIPFDKLGNLYLINGVTGSGKTTIFDAISYALFDVPSGSLREKEYLRSHFAPDSVKTFVEFSFLFNGEEYKIYRSPIQKRKKLKGEGVTEIQAEVQLYLPDGKIIEKNETVRQSINEILGINAQQFSQIALLAQGEFLKLLNSDTQTRSSIFRTIFKTQKYSALAQKLKDKFIFYKNTYTSDKNSILQYVNQISTQEDEILCLKNSYIENSELNSLDDFVLKLKNENKTDEKIYSEKNKQLSDIQKKLIEYNNKLESIKNKKELMTRKTQAEKEFEKNEKDFLIFEKQYKSLDKKQEQRENLKKNINELLDNIEKINIIEKETKILETEKSKEQKNKKELEDLNLKLQKTKENYTKSVYFEYKDLETELKISQNEFLEYQKQLEKEKNEYNNFENLYLSVQAGILAQDLKDGVPCCVCGSTVHPNPAKLENSEISKEELNKKKKALEKNQKKLNELSEFCALKKSDMNNKKDFFEKLKSQFSMEINIENEEKTPKKNYEQEIKELEAKIEESKIKKEEIVKNISGILSKISTLEKDVKNLDKDKTQEEYKNSVNNIEKIEKEIKEIEDNFNKSNVELQKTKSIIKLLTSQIDELKDTDIALFDNLQESYNKIEVENKNLQLELENISIKKNLNFDLISKIEKKYLEFSKNENLYKEYKILSDLANGNMANKAKITFEQYIQGYYLDMVLYEANEHLKRMSKNRFELKRRIKTDNLVSKTALELDVMDFHTFKTRSTKTLSGGESFMAALSLALGLSDCVSNVSGIINIDTLFIDEGFGTLDSESLDLAMRVICDLSSVNRQIGIISHVDELKNKITNKIITTKTESGSKIELVY